MGKPEFSFDTASGSVERNTSGNEGSAGEVISASNGVGSQNNGIGNENNGDGNKAGISGEIIKKRGRKAYPRDVEGNIIRPDGKESNSPVQKAEKLALGGFKPNDRNKVAQQIQGIHAAVATLTKQPIFMLQPQEAIALTGALCDVLDYHKINLFEAGGQYGLYLALIVTVFGVYKPRLDFVKNTAKAKVTSVAPSTPGEAENTGSGQINFGDMTIN